jgi:uncharacterized repeat protein (TIGR03843 family)
VSLAEALAHADLHPMGRVAEASNLVLVCELSNGQRQQRCVYKPASGERPLWDFPDTSLAAREVLTARVARALGWDIVPETVWRTDGPLGPGMCQEWVTEAAIPPVVLAPPDQVAPDWLVVAEGRAEDGRTVVLAHADDADLQRVAVLDALVNNADRKGGHVLRRADGRLAAIDHGVTLHADPKLRTVLWGWAGAPVPEAILDAVADARSRCAALLAEPPVGGWITDAERVAFAARTERLLAARTFPVPGSGWPSLPWPHL